MSEPNIPEPLATPRLSPERGGEQSAEAAAAPPTRPASGPTPEPAGTVEAGSAEAAGAARGGQRPGDVEAESTSAQDAGTSAEGAGASARDEGACVEAAQAGGGDERAQRRGADRAGGYHISHLVDARLEPGGWFYLVEWEGYDASERSWEPHWGVLQRGDPELETQAAALRDAVQRGAQSAAAPLEPGAHAWLGGLTTKQGKAWLKKEGGGVHATVAKAPEPGAADSAARKAYVRLQGVRHNGRVVRAWTQHVWPVAPADPATAPPEYDEDEVGSLHEPSPPPSPRRGPPGSAPAAAGEPDTADAPAARGAPSSSASW